MRTPPLQRVPALRRGDPIGEAWIGQLVATVNGLVDAARGGATANAQAELLAIVGAAQPPGRAAWARITAVDVDAGAAGLPGAPGAHFPDDIRYTAVELGRPEAEMGPAYPDFGRPVRNNEARVYPAAVGDLCLILKDPGGGVIRPRLMLLPGSEVVARRKCQPGPA